MKMPRDLAVFRRRIVVVSAALIALCTAACMALLVTPLIDADMTARRHMLEEFSNQPFDIDRTAADSEADGTSGLVVTGPDISWCRVAVDESGEAGAVECGGAAAVDRLSESVATQLVSLRDEVGSQPFSFDGRKSDRPLAAPRCPEWCRDGLEWKRCGGRDRSKRDTCLHVS